MMGEVAGLVGDWAAMDEVLTGNMAIVDDLAEKGLAAISLASMYHKIGHNYVKVSKTVKF
jgi:adenine/guanine phosphoribosyltransferase-like PRPP-binding protein